MLMLDTFALLATVAVSALDPTSTFHYMKYPTIFRRNNVACQVCYGTMETASSCIGLDPFRCSYAAVVQALRLQAESDKAENDVLKTKVDSMMYDIVLEASVYKTRRNGVPSSKVLDSLKEYDECVPLVSSYTQCNKENWCTGCKSCECDEDGRWRCTESQKCSRRLQNIDHRVLQTVIDNLKFGTNSNRHKRSNEDSPSHNIYNELPEWMYTPNKIKGPGTTAYENVSTAITTETINNQDNDNLVFDDILDNDELKHFIKYNEKYVWNDEQKDIKQDSQNFLDVLQNIEEDFNEKETLNTSNTKPSGFKITNDDTDDSDFGLDYSNFALKRHARHVNKPETRNETVGQNDTTKDVTDTIGELDHLVNILSALMKTQLIELEDLNYIKNHLLKFIKKYKGNANITDDLNENFNYSDNNHTTRDWNAGLLHFYTNKFKRDMKDIIKDINAIQKLKKLGVLVPGSMTNLKPLLFTLTSFYHKINDENGSSKGKYSSIPNYVPLLNNKTASIKNSTEVNTLLDNKMPTIDPKPQRRHYNPEESKLKLIDSYKVILIKRALVRILVIIDENKLTTSLSVLTPRTKDVLTRIIEKQFANNHPQAVQNVNFKVSDILTNLSDLWQNVQHEISESLPSDRLYTVKLLHLTLSQDIDKLKSALNAIKYNSTRRMNSVDSEVSEDLITNVTKYLDPLDKFVNSVLDSMKEKKPKMKKISQALWKKIKTYVVNIKNRMTHYIRNKAKIKSSIVNDMASRRVNEVNQQKFIQVMKEWQQKFDNINARDKRSTIHITKRMKNIIPKYLQGKVPSFDLKKNGDENYIATKARKRNNIAKLVKGNNKGASRSRPATTTYKPNATRMLSTTKKSNQTRVKLLLRHIQH